MSDPIRKSISVTMEFSVVITDEHFHETVSVDGCTIQEQKVKFDDRMTREDTLKEIKEKFNKEYVIKNIKELM